MSDKKTNAEGMAVRQESFISHFSLGRSLPSIRKQFFQAWNGLSMRKLVLLLTLLLLASTMRPVLSQDSFPSKPIRILAPAYPGSRDTEVLARLFAPKLAQRFGQPVVVETLAFRPGNGPRATDLAVAKVSPDGHTVFLTDDNEISMAKEANKVLVLAVPVAKGSETTSARTEFGLYLPSATPADVVARWNAAVKAILTLPDVGDVFAKRGMQAAVDKPQEIAQRAVADVANSVRSIAPAPVAAAAPSPTVVTAPATGGFTMIVPAARDSETGFIAENLMTRLAPRSGMPGSLRYMPGVGIEAARQAPGDGRTLLLTTNKAIPYSLNSAFTFVLPLARRSSEKPYFGEYYAIFVPSSTPADIVTALNTELDKIVQIADFSALMSQRQIQTIGGTAQSFREGILEASRAETRALQQQAAGTGRQSTTSSSGSYGAGGLAQAKLECERKHADTVRRLMARLLFVARGCPDGGRDRRDGRPICPAPQNGVMGDYQRVAQEVFEAGEDLTNAELDSSCSLLAPGLEAYRERHEAEQSRMAEQLSEERAARTERRLDRERDSVADSSTSGAPDTSIGAYILQKGAEMERTLGRVDRQTIAVLDQVQREREQAQAAARERAERAERNRVRAQQDRADRVNSEALRRREAEERAARAASEARSRTAAASAQSASNSLALAASLRAPNAASSSTSGESGSSMYATAGRALTDMKEQEWARKLAAPKTTENRADALGQSSSQEAARQQAMSNFEHIRSAMEALHASHSEYGRIVSVGETFCRPIRGVPTREEPQGPVREWLCNVPYVKEKLLSTGGGGSVMR